MDEDALLNLVRIGTVTDVKGRQARVKFQDTGITSGWLFVVQHYGTQLSITTDQAHKHSNSTAGYWTPKVNDTVLCIYMPVFNGDGFILGGVG